MYFSKDRKVYQYGSERYALQGARILNFTFGVGLSSVVEAPHILRCRWLR